jgi:cytoskeletal protein RodZ
MKRLREQRGVTLRQIADKTKISMATLEALERDDISGLPGGIFSRGIVRAYAEEVGADPETGVREFILQFPDESLAPGNTLAHRDHFGPEVSWFGRRTAILMVIVVPLGAFLVWLFALR